MTKRFNVRLALEDVQLLEVDKEASLTPEEIAIRDMAKKTELDNDTISPVPVEKEDTTAEDDVSKLAESLPADTPEIDSVESAEKSAEDEKESDSEDVAIQTAASLEAIACIMHASLDKGGMSPVAAHAANITLESLYTRIGVKIKETNFPALESFDSISARKRNTEVALEGIGDILGRIWAALAKSVKNIARRFKDKINSFIFSLRTSRSQLKAIKAAARKMKRDEPYSGQFKAKTLINNLSINGEFNPLNSILKSIKLVKEAKDHSLAEAIRSYKSITTTIELDDNKIDGISVYKPNFSLANVFADGLKVIDSNNKFINTYKNSNPLPGGVNIEFNLPKGNVKDEDLLAALSMSNVHDSNQENDQERIEFVDFIKKNEIDNFIKQIDSLLHELEMYAVRLNNADWEVFHLAEKLEEKANHYSGHSSLGAVLVGMALTTGSEYLAQKKKANRTKHRKESIISIKAVSNVLIDLNIIISSLAYSTLSASLKYTNSSIRAYL